MRTLLVALAAAGLLLSTTQASADGRVRDTKAGIARSLNERTAGNMHVNGRFANGDISIRTRRLPVAGFRPGSERLVNWRATRGIATFTGTATARTYGGSRAGTTLSNFRILSQPRGL